ncbi:hypothetical protein [Mesorhizobium sp. ES1-1]|uniref:hypothetical protein n=1 Tax=Mesorhizobium sp. ES1-1 TaxID=2876629 RepID=UPI001CC9DE12|nr:hypothetical protein [Mesorhizobium sp. ES1-1]MBZ9676865.1 hypothetical protein [Mesorhizobium sp. ES1-1]
MTRIVRDMVKLRAGADKASKEIQAKEQAERIAKTARLKALREAQPVLDQPQPKGLNRPKR